MGWCPACVAAKAKESPHYQQKDRLPVIQLDYTFVSTKGVIGEPTGQQTILTLVDVRIQLATAIIVLRGYRSQALSLRFWQDTCHTTDRR